MNLVETVLKAGKASRRPAWMTVETRGRPPLRIEAKPATVGAAQFTGPLADPVGTKKTTKKALKKAAKAAKKARAAKAKETAARRSPVRETGDPASAPVAPPAPDPAVLTALAFPPVHPIVAASWANYNAGNSMSMPLAAYTGRQELPN